jgi:hypothetical protein
MALGCFWRIQVRSGRVCVALGAALWATVLGWPLLARNAVQGDRLPDPAQTCLHAAYLAAQDEDVPLSVLLTVALVETGRAGADGLHPWAWAVRAHDRGHWPETAQAALGIAQAAQASGAENIDLGCFQINLRWHGDAFDSLTAMLDPGQNARYAARLLRGHHARLGDWSLAAGAYHSGRAEHAARYRARFDARLPDGMALAQAAQGVVHAAPRARQASAEILPASAGGIALHLAHSARPLLPLGGTQ